MPARRRRVGAEPEQQSYSFYRDSGAQLGHYDPHENEALLGTTTQQQETPTMTSRDRTQEFGNAIQSMQSRTASRAAVLRSPRQAKHLQSYSNFMLISKNIGKNIASTYAKLEKLAMCKDNCYDLCGFLFSLIYRKTITIFFSGQEKINL